MKARLVLGCHGRMQFGFTMCAGTINEIYNLSNLPEGKEAIYEYLDGHCKLFDKVTQDVNKINSIIQYLARQGVLPPHVEQNIYDYIAMHKKCGFYMYIEPLE